MISYGCPTFSLSSDVRRLLKVGKQIEKLNDVDLYRTYTRALKRAIKDGVHVRRLRRAKIKLNKNVFKNTTPSKDNADVQAKVDAFVKIARERLTHQEAFHTEEFKIWENHEKHSKELEKIWDTDAKACDKFNKVHEAFKANRKIAHEI